jgi:hypothetical protein
MKNAFRPANHFPWKHHPPFVIPFPDKFVIPTEAQRSGESAPWKGGAFQREVAPPGSWFVPPGNNRSSGRGNEVAEAFGGKGRESDSVSVQAVTRVNVEQASKDAMQEPTHLSLGEGRSWWKGASEQLSTVLPG